MLKKKTEPFHWRDDRPVCAAGAGGTLCLPSAVFIPCSNAPSSLDQLYKFPPLFVTNPTTDNFTELIQLLFGIPHSPLPVHCQQRLCQRCIDAGKPGAGEHGGYPLAKHTFPGKKLMQKMVVMSLLFTSVVTYIPQYVVIAKMGLLNTQWSVILPMFMMPLGLYLMQNFIMLLNDSMLEAARIDGAGEFRIYASVVMPNCKPAWLTLIIFAFQQVWNNNGNLYICKSAEDAAGPSQFGSGRIQQCGASRRKRGRFPAHPHSSGADFPAFAKLGGGDHEHFRYEGLICRGIP